MPPRHTYWTIIYGNQPTAFRSATAEELLPTLRQLQSKHPDAIMMWFARGRLWRSPEEAREALVRQRARPRFQSARPPGSDRPPDRDRRPAGTRTGGRPPSDKPRWSERRGPQTEDGRRTRDWRPGGAHRDPRDRFKVPRDVKRQRFAARVRRDANFPKPPREHPRSARPPKKKDDEK